MKTRITARQEKRLSAMCGYLFIVLILSNFPALAQHTPIQQSFKWSIPRPEFNIFSKFFAGGMDSWIKDTC
jgi:hypothetical protein